jgi:hypothetical protein
VKGSVILNVIKGVLDLINNVLDASTFSFVTRNKFPNKRLAVSVNVDIIVGGVFDAGIQMLFSEGIGVGHSVAPNAGSH